MRRIKPQFRPLKICSATALLMLLTGSVFCETAPAEFVSLQNDSGVWWFKSPAGKPFLSIGVNHVEPFYWQSPNNKSFVLDTYGPDLFAPNETFQDGSPAVEKWAQRVASNLTTWGFNTLGVHNPPSKSLRAAVRGYYVVELGLPCNWGWNFQRSILVSAFKKKPLDVFDASFTSAVQSQAAELVKPRAGDPQVLGYTYTDGPPWIIEDDSGSEDFQKLTVAEKIIHPWCLALMSLPAEANGKQVWLATMKERYSSPELAGATYACKVSGWDELASTTAWTSISDSAKAADDSLAFMEKIMRQWYEVRRDAIRQYDRNHLILGDKLNMNRDSKCPDQLTRSLHVMRDYVDVIDIQYYAPFDTQRAVLALIYKESGKPILTGDTACCPLWKDETSYDADFYHQMGKTYADDVTKLFSLPYFIGWHHCGYIRGLRREYVAALKRNDQKSIEYFKNKKLTYREGFFTEFEEPIEPILNALGPAISNCENLHRASTALDNNAK
ncbi:MAG: hypothetical protein WC701_07075 [Kiritimatiellales bacterium]|jgi:hypothetical protein